MYFIENKEGTLINVFHIKTIEMRSDGPVAFVGDDVSDAYAIKIKHADYTNLADNGHLSYLHRVFTGKET